MENLFRQWSKENIEFAVRSFANIPNRVNIVINNPTVKELMSEDAKLFILNSKTPIYNIKVRMEVNRKKKTRSAKVRLSVKTVCDGKLMNYIIKGELVTEIITNEFDEILVNNFVELMRSFILDNDFIKSDIEFELPSLENSDLTSVSRYDGLLYNYNKNSYLGETPEMVKKEPEPPKESFFKRLFSKFQKKKPDESFEDNVQETKPELLSIDGNTYGVNNEMIITKEDVDPDDGDDNNIIDFNQRFILNKIK